MGRILLLRVSSCLWATLKVQNSVSSSLVLSFLLATDNSQCFPLVISPISIFYIRDAVLLLFYIQMGRCLHGRHPTEMDGLLTRISCSLVFVCFTRIRAGTGL